jgi:hypothetical protein
VLHQNLPHELRRNGEEMSAVLEMDRLLPGEAQVSFVHQVCGLQGVIGAFLSQMAPRQAAQFVVD